jgi:Tfp pilus assembly protein PilW
MSLVELMVALAISLVVLYTVVSLYGSTRMNNRLQTGVSRINENAQMTAELLARDIRQISNMGCPALGDAARGFRRLSRNSIDATGAPNTFSMTPTNVIQLLPASAETKALAGTVVIEVTHAANNGVHLNAKMTSRAALTDIFLRGDPGIKIPTSLSSSNSYPAAIISDCATAELFQVVDAKSNPWSVSPFGALRTLYAADARVMPVAKTRYFIGNYTGEIAARAIYRRRTLADGYNWETIPQPLIHNVQAMNVSVEVDTDGDFSADATIPYGSTYDPAQVVGLTLGLTFQAPAGVVGTGGAPVTRSSAASVAVRARNT